MIARLSRCPSVPGHVRLQLTDDSQVLAVSVDGTLASMLAIHFEDDYLDYLMFSYAYTFPEHRRQGYSTRLRQAAISTARRRGARRVVSVPFEGAHSVGLLGRMGFTEADGIYVLTL
jgi:GNAT superfamily N-acetyltransferase